jgi:hypothetical protein
MKAEAQRATERGRAFNQVHLPFTCDANALGKREARREVALGCFRKEQRTCMKEHRPVPECNHAI